MSPTVIARVRNEPDDLPNYNRSRHLDAVDNRLEAMMKINNGKGLIITLLSLVVSFGLFSQNIEITGIVKDSQTKEPLSFCNISIQASNKGTITNLDGAFNISVKHQNDILEFSYLGYVPLKITAKDLLSQKIVLLKKQDYMLPEITVNANDDFLYALLNNCRKNLNKNKERAVSKVYYGIESHTEDTPVEFLECYFNGNVQGHRIISLLLKNGRIAKSVYKNCYYSNQETTKAIRLLKLEYDNGYYPAFPLQLDRNEMEKLFNLCIIPSDSSMFHVSFKPKSNVYENFSGEIWMDKETMLPLKIDLNIDKAEIFPFATSCEDSITDVSINISLNYKIDNGNMYPELICFDFVYTILRGKAGQVLDASLDAEQTYHSNGVLYFYDFDMPFVLPFFEYDTEIYDYQKLQLIPYNHNFWDYNEALLLSESQKKTIGFLVEDSLQFYYEEGNYGRDFGLHERTFINEDTVGYSAIYTFWYPNKRVMIKKTYPKNKTASLQAILTATASMLVKLKTQILLDVNTVGDSLACDTYAVFEEINSHYKMPVETYTNPMVNMYFDICEIKRRELQAILDTSRLSLEEIKKLYYRIEEEKEVLSYDFLTETDYGANKDRMKEWNQYIIDNLGIDNISMFEEYYEKRRIRNDSIIKSGGTVPLNEFE